MCLRHSRVLSCGTCRRAENVQESYWVINYVDVWETEKQQRRRREVAANNKLGATAEVRVWGTNDASTRAPRHSNVVASDSPSFVVQQCGVPPPVPPPYVGLCGRPRPCSTVRTSDGDDAA